MHNTGQFMSSKVITNQLNVKVNYFNKLLIMHTHCKTVQSAVMAQFFVDGKQQTPSI